MSGKATRWRVFAAVGVGIFMATLDSSIVNVSLPSIGTYFGIDIAIAQWVSIAYLITIAALILPAGRLADLIGRSRAYIAGLVLFTVGSLICGIAPSAGALIGSRALQALGASLIMATGAALLTDAWPAEKRGQAMGLGGMTVSVGLMTGPPLGGFLSHALDWRWIFYVNLPVGIISTILALRALRGIGAKPGRPGSFDIPGALVLGGFMTSLSLGLTLGQRQGWQDPWAIGLTAAAPLLLVLFIWRELTARDPMLNLGLFLNRTFSSASVAALVSFAGQFPLLMLLPFYLQGVLGYSELTTGLVILVLPLVTALLAPYAGKLSDRVGTRWPTVLGMVIRALCYVLLLRLGTDSSHWDVIVPLAILALGSAAFGPANNSAIMGAVPVENRGIAASMSSAMRSLGMVIGAAAGTAIAAARAGVAGAGTKGAVLDALSRPEAFVKGFHAAVIFSMVCALLGAAAAAARPNDAGMMSRLMGKGAPTDPPSE